MKVCSKCKVEKDESEFGNYKRSKDGLQYMCKYCHNSQGKLYAKNNTEKKNAYGKIYREKNVEKCRALIKEWAQRNKEKCKEKDARYRKNHPEKIKERQADYRKNNPEKKNEHLKRFQKKDRENLGNCYIKTMISGGKIPFGLIPKELIEFKRIQLKIKRLIKEKESA